MAKCSGKMEIYSRVTGYFRPIESFNAGKREEFINRLEYDVTKQVEKKPSYETELSEVLVNET